MRPVAKPPDVVYSVIFSVNVIIFFGLFSSCKKYLQNYPAEELLLVFDRDFTYGQNFYLVSTEESKKRILEVRQ